MPESAKISISQKNKGHVVTPETREKIRQGHLGKKRDPEVTRKIQETKRKNREAGLYKKSPKGENGE